VDDELLVAAATVPVTPPPGHPLGGYAARAGETATGAHDPLEASIIWIGAADEPGVAWLCLDSIGVDTVLAAKLAAAVAGPTGLPSEHVLVCASHTHCGPIGWTGGVHPAHPAEREPGLVEALVTAVGTASRELVGRRVPMRLSWCAALIDGIGSNRHDPAGPHDRSSGVLVAHNDSEVAAVLLDYACHPTVLGPETLQWSADWPGSGRRMLATALSVAATAPAPPPTIGFLQGAAGDISPRFVRRSRDHREVGRLGAIFAGDVLRTIGLRAKRIRPEVPRVARTTVTLPTRSPVRLSTVDRIVSEASAADRVMAGAPDAPQARIARTRLEGAEALRSLGESELPAELRLPVSAVRIGDLAWLHVPVELYTSFAQRIRDLSPFPVTRVVGYTDGYFGYVADEAAHSVGAYEALISFFDPAAGELLVDGCARLLAALRIP
jgi:hypothetical protein